MKRFISISCVALAAVPLAATQAAQEISRSTIASGGGRVAVGSVAAITTIGQAIAGTASGTSHAVGSGFWHGGPGVLVEVSDGALPVPGVFRLHRGVPNPFNPTIRIPYDVPAGGGRVRLRVYDVNGRLVASLVDRREAPGRKQVSWHARDSRDRPVSSGVYFLRMEANGYRGTQRVQLLK